ncbi:MAG: GGDEF domain-containing protein [Firmicutes bacterium]|nr:GGDEF domain-containing protein [Bacillota bacterium]
MKQVTIILLLLCLIIPSAAAARAVEVPRDVYQLNPYMEVLPDPSGEWTLADVTGALDQDFRKLTKKDPNFGYSRWPYWVRIDFDEELDVDEAWILEIANPRLQGIDLYILQNGTWHHVEAKGSSLSQRRVSLIDAGFAFRLPPATTKLTVYARIVANGSMDFPMKLWSFHEFTRYVNRIQIFWGIYYGLILAMIIYNGFLFLSTKSISYLHYVLLTASMALFQIADSGQGYAYLWPNHPWWDQKCVGILAGLSLTMTIIFSRSYLDTKATHHKLDMVLCLCQWSGLGVSLLGVFLPAGWTIRIGILLAFLSLPILGAMTVLRIKQGFQPALFYAGAFLALYLGGTVSAFRYLGVLPTNFITSNGLKLGYMLEATILSFGVSSYISAMQRERMEEQHRLELLETLHESTSSLLGTLELNKVVELVLQAALTLTGHETGLIFLKNDSGFVIAALGPGLSSDLLGKALPSFQFSNRAAQVRDADLSPYGLAGKARSLLVMPIDCTYRLLGGIVLFSQRDAFLTESDLHLIKIGLKQGGSAIASALRYDEKSKQATIDGLTGAFNRNHFLELGQVAFAQSREDGLPLSFIMLDIDHFKEVNDRYGHSVGDQVLQQLVNRFNQIIRKTDILGRYGGEEFGIILKDANPKESWQLAERLRRAVEQNPLAIGDLILPITISLGVASLENDHSLADLIERADKAMYRAKAKGRNRVELG